MIKDIPDKTIDFPDRLTLTNCEFCNANPVCSCKLSLTGTKRRIRK